MFHGLPGIFVAGQMVAFTVVRGRDAVRVRGEIVELCGSLMSVIGHFLVSQQKEKL